MTTREHETQASGAEPPVIDLAAEEVGGDTGKPDEAKPETESVSSAAEQPSRRPPTKTIVAAVVAVLAVVAGALLYRNFGERVWPGDRILALEDRIASLDATAHTFSSQLAGLGAAVDRMRAAGAAAGAKIDDAAATAHDASERLKDLEGRMGEAEADLKRQQEALASLRPAAAGSTQSGGASSAQLAALDKRVKALEDSLAALKSAPPSPIGGNADNAVLSQALADLKAKLAGGAPYEAEAGTIDRLVPGIPGLGRLRPYAHSGLPTVESLAHELERIAAGFPLTEPQAGTGDGSYWDSISRWLGSIVTVRMIGAADWKAISTQAAADAKAGRLAEAVTRLADSETALPPELAQWREKAKARLGADAMVEEVSAAVLRVLGSGKS